MAHPRPQSLQSIWSAGRLSALVTVTTGCREIHDIQLRMSIKINFYCACFVLEKLTTRNEGFCEETDGNSKVEGKIVKPFSSFKKHLRAPACRYFEERGQLSISTVREAYTNCF